MKIFSIVLLAMLFVIISSTHLRISKKPPTQFEQNILDGIVDDADDIMKVPRFDDSRLIDDSMAEPLPTLS
jgi:hypothetical protein